MNEAGFIRALRSRLPDHLAVWKVSDRITKGVPDLAIFGPDGTLLWLEAKYSKTNYKTHVKPNLSLPSLFLLALGQNALRRAGFVDDIDGLVRQMAVGDKTHREVDGGSQCRS